MHSTCIMSLSPQLLSFPSELLIMGLQPLGHRDLIVCSMVCRRFHSLIKEVIELSYTVELGIDGFVDGPPSDLRASDRLRILLDLRSRWHTLDWVKRQTIESYTTRPRHRNMHYSQGIFSQAMCPSLATGEGYPHYSIFSTMLPTRAAEAAERGSLGDDNVWYRAFCMDPAADVVIFLVTGKLFHNASLQSYSSFDPRSLSSNGTRLHPLCQSKALRRIQFITGAYNARISNPRIAGDMVGVTVSCDGENSIVIYNWQSGELVVRMTSCFDESRWSVRDFTFLSSRSFVLSAELSNARTPESALLLFTFCDEFSDGAPWAVADGVVQHIVTLLLPEVAEGQRSSGYINTTPCASYQPCGLPFKVEDPCRILVYDAGSSTGVRMVVHTDVFSKARKLLSTGSMGKGRSIPWDAWGLKYTRLFMHRYIDLPQNPIYGERVVMHLTDTADTCTAQSTYLLDFNRGAYRRQVASEPLLVTELTTFKSSLFAKPITTSLPYTAVRIPNAHLYSSFLLDEQRLLGLKGLQPVREIEAFVF